MLRLLGFIIKVGILVGGAMWLAARPGSVNISWMEYDITLHFGFFLLILFVFIILSVGLARLMLYLRNLPVRYGEKKSLHNAEKGLEALTLSLSAASAGDVGYARHHAARAEKLLPGQNQPLPLLIQAHAMRCEGEHDQADELLQKILKNREGALLAARSLIQNAISKNDVPLALGYGRQVLKNYKGRDEGWLLKTLYNLETLSRHWDEALSLLKKLERKKLIQIERVSSDRAALFYTKASDTSVEKDQQFLLQKALKEKSDFVPAVTQLAWLYERQGKRRAACRLIEKTWVLTPHPEMAVLWMSLRKVKKRTSKPVEWAFKLVKLNPHHIESHLLRARVAIDQKQWEEARAAIQSAEEIKPIARVYKLWVELEDVAGHGDGAVRQRYEQLATAMPDPAWMCEVTGRLYPLWQPIGENSGAFNTIKWVYPDTAIYGIDGYLTANEDLSPFELIKISS